MNTNRNTLEGHSDSPVASCHPQARSQWGFTLMELMVVVAIICILCGVAYPNFVTARTQLRTSEDARTVAMVLGELRAEAIRLRRPIRITFTNNTMSWDFYNDGVIDDGYTFSAGTTWTATPADITFNGFGLARGIVGTRTLTVSHGISSYSVRINSNGHVEL